MVQSLKEEYEDVHARLTSHLDREAQLEAEIEKLTQQLAGHDDVVKASKKKIEELQSILDEKSHSQQLLALQSEQNERRIKEKETAEKRLKEELEK